MVDWSPQEVEAVISDYMSMLASELAGTPYNKAAHRRALKPLLNGRSDQSIEFKHCNISAVLLEANFPYIAGYKPRFNYQRTILPELVLANLQHRPPLIALAAADADRLMVAPEVPNILAVLEKRPPSADAPQSTRADPPSTPTSTAPRLTTNYLEREAQNRSLGDAGEAFIIEFERTRLIRAGHESLAAKIEHTAKVHGDHMGFDILSFEDNGAERFIEVKTTKYGSETPFFATRNEVAVSERHAEQYQVYRLHSFRLAPKLFILPGAISTTCQLTPATFLARVR